jgi:hypothetical protein
MNGTEFHRGSAASVAGHGCCRAAMTVPIIFEALAAVGDFEALQFEQSITLVNEMGFDYDQNPPDPIHKLNCRSDYFRR